MVKLVRNHEESMKGEINGEPAYSFCSSRKKVSLQIILKGKREYLNQYAHQSKLSRRVIMKNEERIAVLSKEIQLIEYYLRVNEEKLNNE